MCGGFVRGEEEQEIKGAAALILAFTCKLSAAGRMPAAAGARGCLGSCCTERLPIPW